MNKIKVLTAGLIFLLACNKKRDNNVYINQSLIPSPIDSVVGNYTGKWTYHVETGRIDTFYGAFDTAYVTTISISKIDDDSIKVDFGNTIVQRYRYYHGGIAAGNSFLIHVSTRNDTLIYYPDRDSLYCTIQNDTHNPIKPYDYTNTYSTFKAKKQ